MEFEIPAWPPLAPFPDPPIPKTTIIPDTTGPGPYKRREEETNVFQAPRQGEKSPATEQPNRKKDREMTRADVGVLREKFREVKQQGVVSELHTRRSSSTTLWNLTVRLVCTITSALANASREYNQSCLYRSVLNRRAMDAEIRVEQPKNRGSRTKSSMNVMGTFNEYGGRERTPSAEGANDRAAVNSLKERGIKRSESRPLQKSSK